MKNRLLVILLTLIAIQGCTTGQKKDAALSARHRDFRSTADAIVLAIQTQDHSALESISSPKILVGGMDTEAEDEVNSPVLIRALFRNTHEVDWKAVRISEDSREISLSETESETRPFPVAFVIRLTRIDGSWKWDVLQVPSEDDSIWPTIKEELKRGQK